MDLPPPRRKFTPDQDKEIVQSYLNGASCTDVGRKFNCSPTTICTVLQRYGVARTGVRVFTDKEEALIVTDYLDLKSTGLVAKKWNCNGDIIRAAVKRQGCSLFPTKGPGSPKWTGKTLNTNGYVLVRILQDDPMFSMADKRGWVAEHRLVVARDLNRCLLPFPQETVHHKDLNPENNDISNLQLRVGSHGIGGVINCKDCSSYRFDRDEDLVKFCLDCKSYRLAADPI